MNDKPSFALKFFGWFSAVLMFLGGAFKLNHWAGAGIMIIVGSTSFLLFYLPLWFIQLPKKGHWFNVIVYSFTLFLFGIFYLFKSQYWPGAGIITKVWGLYLLFFLFPFSLFLLYKTGKKSFPDFHFIIVVFLLVSTILIWIGRYSSSMVKTTDQYLKNIEQKEQMYNQLLSKRNQLYAAFEQLREKEKNVFYIKAVQLKNISDSTEKYIRSFRNHLLSLNEQISELEADTFPISELRSNDDINLPTGEICGWDEYKPKSGKFSGTELKLIIEKYRDSVINFVESENKEFIKAGINLNTSQGIDEDGEPIDWVFATFSHLPMSAILAILENIRYEIKNTETQVLADLLNSASKNSSDNLASTIADLGNKLENEKQKHDIENLQKEGELSQLRLNEKNSEIEQTYQTIVFFSIGLLGCLVMIFFIIRSNLIRKKINRELASQKQIIEIKNKEITDSINYAKRIQQAILPPADLISSTLPDSFVLYKPKDVVSGDFYGFILRDECVIIIVADCTGHGVPGAFMSMIGNDLLANIILEKNISQPAQILNELHKGIRTALKQDKSESGTRDGMDIALCKLSLEIENRQMEYAGAMRPLWIIRDNKLLETKADKQSIGGLESDNRKPFTNHTTGLQKNDCIYLFSDGYADQFGGEKGKKFMMKKFESMLIEINKFPMKEQEKIINQKFESWKGNGEQVDDVLILGVKI